MHSSTPLLNGHHIEECSITYLGINLTSDLMWSIHVHTVSQRARGLVGLLYRQFYQYADTNTMKHLYISLANLSTFEVCMHCVGSFLAKDIQLLEKVQNFAANVQSNGTGAMKSCCIFYNYLHSK